MRKVFEYIGLISLMCFSFFITEKTSTIAKNTDDIMIMIKDEYAKYEVASSDAIIDGLTIIPGRCGKKVNIDESYNNMHQTGFYDDQLYKYDNVLPSISLETNYDKQIVSGNKQNNYLYLFIKLDNSNKDLITKYQFTNYNFIVNSTFYLNNKDLIDQLNKNNSILISASSFKDYKMIDKDYLAKKDNHIFCFNDNADPTFLKNCSSNKSNTIGPMLTIDKQFLLSVKMNLARGKFILLTLNNSLIEELPNVEKYIASRGLINSSIDMTLREC